MENPLVKVTLSKGQTVFGVRYEAGEREVTPGVLAQLQARNQRRPGLIVEHQATEGASEAKPKPQVKATSSDAIPSP